VVRASCNHLIAPEQSNRGGCVSILPVPEGGINRLLAVLLGSVISVGIARETLAAPIASSSEQPAVLELDDLTSEYQKLSS
jgi:hypothetical protein